MFRPKCVKTVNGDVKPASTTIIAWVIIIKLDNIKLIRIIFNFNFILIACNWGYNMDNIKKECYPKINGCIQSSSRSKCDGTIFKIKI